MIKKIYIFDPFTKLHKFLIKNIKLELNDKFEVIEINDISNYDGIIIIFVNHHFIKDNLLQENYNKLKNNKYNILYITEPLNFIIEINFYKKMIRHINPFLLLTYSYGNFNKLNCFQKMLKFYPINNKYFNFIKNNPHRDETKIVFIGKMNDNRKHIKEILKDRLIIIEDMWSEEEWMKIMSKYLFFINVHRRRNCGCLETLRVYPLLYNGCVVFSEYINNKEMDIYSKFNIVFYKENELMDTINNYKIDYNEIEIKKNKFRNTENNCVLDLCNVISNL